MGSFPVVYAALAGLRVLSGVDREDRRMFALERVGRSGVRGSVGPHARERPHPRSVPAGRISGTGLGLRVESSSSGCSSSVAERLVRLPHGVEDDGKLARHSDLRLLEAGALGDSQTPSFQGREANLSRQDDVGRLVEMGSRQLVAALRDAAVSTDLTRLVAPGCQAEIGAGAGESTKAGSIVIGRGDRQRDHGADAGCGHEQPGHGILFRGSANARVENLDPLDDGFAGLHHRLDDCLDLGRGHQLAGDDLFRTAGKAADLLPEHDAEGLQ